MKTTLFAFSALFIAASFLSSAEPDLDRVAEDKARALMTKHLKRVGEPHEEWAIKLEPYGVSTWLVNCFPMREKPSLPWRHVMNSKGRVEELNADSLNVVFLNEYPATPKKEDRTKLIDDFTKLHAGEHIKIITKAADIPGHEKAPLDADIADAVRAPFDSGKLTTVVYTYQQIGGVVRRYRFTFQDGERFSKAECAVVGRGIGEAHYYE